MDTEHLLKILCEILFLLGFGDCWYDGRQRETFIYKIYGWISFLIHDACMFLEFLAGYYFQNFPPSYVNSAKTLTITHAVIMIKRYSVRHNRKKIRDLNRIAVQTCRLYEDDDAYREQYKKIRNNVLFYTFAIYTPVFLFYCEGVIRALTQDEPLIIIVTYWPKYEDRTNFATAIRVTLGVVLLCKMIIMTFTDVFVVSHMIIFQSKCKTLKKYFNNLKQDFDDNINDTAEIKAVKLRQGFREGIIMHQELLRLFKDIQEVFDIPMSMQVCLSSGSAVMLLMKIALGIHNMTIIVGSVDILFLMALLVLLATILWNAGDVTHEASLLPEAICNCGWHLGAMTQPAHNDVRKLVLLACAQAQRPLVIKAFAISDLSYALYVAVLRTTYSVFAVMYTRNNSE